MSSETIPGGEQGGLGPRRGAARAERSRQAILDAAAEILARNRGASMREIAENAGVGRSTIHNFFPSREDLIRAIVADALAECEAAIATAHPEDGPVREAVVRLAEAFVPIGERFGFLLAEGQTMDDPELAAIDARVTGPAVELIERGKREGVFRVDWPTAWISGSFEALVYAAWEGVRNGELAPREAPRFVAETLLSGAGPGSV